MIRQERSEAEAMIDTLFFNPRQKPYLLEMTKNNTKIIKEIKEYTEQVPWLRMSVIGVVGKKRWCRVCRADEHDESCQVIYVDFKARKVLKIAA